MKDSLHLLVTNIEVKALSGFCKIELDNSDGWSANVRSMCMTIGRHANISGKLLYSAIVIEDRETAIRNFTKALESEKEDKNESNTCEYCNETVTDSLFVRSELICLECIVELFHQCECSEWIPNGDYCESCERY